jgi:hypothetical protein
MAQTLDPEAFTDDIVYVDIKDGPSTVKREPVVESSKPANPHRPMARFIQELNKEFTMEELGRILTLRDRPYTTAYINDLKWGKRPGNIQEIVVSVRKHLPARYYARMMELLSEDSTLIIPLELDVRKPNQRRLAILLGYLWDKLPEDVSLDLSRRIYSAAKELQKAQQTQEEV